MIRTSRGRFEQRYFISYCHQKQTPASNHTWSTDRYMFIWIYVIFMMLYLQTIILFYARTCMYLLCIQNICIMLKRALILRKWISIKCSDRWTISSLIICILNNVHVCLLKITVWKKADTFINKKPTNNPIKWNECSLGFECIIGVQHFVLFSGFASLSDCLTVSEISNTSIYSYNLWTVIVKVFKIHMHIQL